MLRCLPIRVVYNVVMKRWIYLLLLLSLNALASPNPRGTYGQQVVAAVLMAELGARAEMG